jgi:hypothetical protein
MSNHDMSGDTGIFSFGVGEMRVARAAQDIQAQILKPERRLQPRSMSVTTREKRGFDPYDSSKGFDRSQNWARVRKR